MTLANKGQKTTMSVIIRFLRFTPKLARIAMAKIYGGIAKKMSVILIMTSSVVPPRYPEAVPATVPTITEATTTISEIRIDNLEPQMRP